MSDQTTELILKAASRVDSIETNVQNLEARFEKAVTEIAQQSHSAFAVGEKRKNLIAEVVNSPALKSLRNREAKVINIALPGSLTAIRKAIVGTDNGTDAESFNVHPQRDNRLGNDPRRMLTLLDVMPRLPVASNSFTFNSLNGYTSNAAVQGLEASVKAETPVPTTLVTANIATVAHWTEASRQVLDDSPALQQQINSLLSYGALRKLEDRLINGSGGVGEIDGLLNQAVIYGADSDVQPADSIGKAASALMSAGWMPNLVILHPADWFAIQSERAVDNQYVVGSGWAQPASPSIWGMAVVVTPAIAQGHALVLDSAQTALLDRMEARVEMGYQGDGFVRNTVTLLAELRAGLAVFSPEAVYHLTF